MEINKQKKIEKEDELVAKASIIIDAPISNVWKALIDPDDIKQYMFGTTVVSDWKLGHPIIWKGEWQGKKYEDKGKILKIEKENKIQYSHYSPLVGKPDIPENYHIVSIELTDNGKSVIVSLTQDNNETDQDREHSEKNWKMMLNEMKTYLETRYHEN